MIYITIFLALVGIWLYKINKIQSEIKERKRIKRINEPYENRFKTPEFKLNPPKTEYCAR